MSFNLTSLTAAPSLGGRFWRLRAYDERQALALSQKFDVSDVVGRLLAARDVTLDSVSTFLNPTLKSLLPDPSCLKDMSKAVERLAAAVQAGEQIAIFGDYDVDGATSSALLWRYFKAIHVAPLIYIPDRFTEGYGPNKEAFAFLKQQGARVIVTVDCGATSFDALAAAQEMGVDVIVFDHHLTEARLPPAFAHVNPNRFDEDREELKHLAAVGVTFLAAIGLNRKLRQDNFFTLERPEPNLLNVLDLVALGSVCDVMPLSGLNRALVAQGLKVMSLRQNTGLRVLLDKLVPQGRLDTYHLGYILGPRINAGGRIGKSDLGVRLLASDDPAEAQQIADQLEHLNLQRRDIEANALAEAQAIAQTYGETAGLVLANTGWHQGIIGIVAGRIKDYYHRPACVVAIEDGVGKGSARSVPGIDIGGVIQRACQKGLLLKGGGHTMAAGFTVDTTQLAEFRTFFENECARLGAEKDLKPYLSIDCGLSVQGASLEMVSSLEQLSPFGIGNPQPRFVFPFVQLRYVRTMGREENGGVQHIGFDIWDEGRVARLPAVAFRACQTEMGKAFLESANGTFHIAGTLKVELWQGRQTVKLFVDDAHRAVP